jgi:cytochrome c oxidase subunit 1
MSELLGKIHFWGSLIGMNLVFAPMFIQGMRGMSRRMADGGVTYFGTEDSALKLNVSITHAAILLAVSQIPFIWNVFASIKTGKRVEGNNPWQATTLDWATPTPPPHGNFAEEPVVYRGPYEYSVPGSAVDFIAQDTKKV